MTSAGTPTPWHVLVPVKRLAAAKSRLAAVPEGMRRELSLAFALDTVAAALRTDGVAAVHVITLDPEVVASSAALGADIVPDVPDAGIVAALTYAESRMREAGAGRLAALAGDLPALRTASLGAALVAAGGEVRSFVPDAAGTGTVLLTTTGPPLDARFGPRSCAAHAASGAVRLELAGSADLRRDVDTEVDLWDAVRLGIGPATAAVLA